MDPKSLLFEIHFYLRLTRVFMPFTFAWLTIFYRARSVCRHASSDEDNDRTPTQASQASQVLAFAVAPAPAALTSQGAPTRVGSVVPPPKSPVRPGLWNLATGNASGPSGDSGIAGRCERRQSSSSQTDQHSGQQVKPDYHFETRLCGQSAPGASWDSSKFRRVERNRRTE